MFDFLAKKFSSIFAGFSGNNFLSEKNIAEAVRKVEEALLEADTPYEVVKNFIESIKSEAIGIKSMKYLKPGEQFIKIINNKLIEFLGGKIEQDFNLDIPSINMIIGLQGSGKTTFIAKLSNFLLRQAAKRGKSRRILAASLDFYRPAAIEQLKILSKAVNIDFYYSKKSDVLSAAKDIGAFFKKSSYDYLLLDTAGRMHVDKDMLQELKNINSILRPKYKTLVLDAMTGQESLKIANIFAKEVDYDFAVLSKMDSSARAGAALSFRYVLKKRISFLGIGEKIDDLELFKADRMASRILGMGDTLSLIEKAEEKIKRDERERIYKSMMRGNITLKDFAKQIDMIEKIGSISQIMQYMPGMASVSQDMLEKSESEVKKFKSIINSMTEKERIYPKLLDGSRKKRVANGAGVEVSDVNNLLKRFEESKQFVKLFKKFSRFQNFYN